MSSKSSFSANSVSTNSSLANVAMEKTCHFHQSRGSFENLYVDDSVIREPPPALPEIFGKGKRKSSTKVKGKSKPVGPLVIKLPQESANKKLSAMKKSKKQTNAPSSSGSSEATQRPVTRSHTRANADSSTDDTSDASSLSKEMQSFARSPEAHVPPGLPVTPVNYKKRTRDQISSPTHDITTLTSAKKIKLTHTQSSDPTSGPETAHDAQAVPNPIKRSRKPSVKAQSAAAANNSTITTACASTNTAAAKKQPQPTVPRGFKGTPSGHGYSLNKPENGQLDAPWQCGFAKCASGMTWLARNKGTDGQPVGRKVISNFFGRNKTSTKLIPDDVWHWMCRKHYQRDKYHSDNDAGKNTATWTADVISDQLTRLKLWRPDATFSVRIMSAGQKRLNQWYATCRKHNGDKDAALAATPTPTSKTATPEQNFPVQLLEHFDNTYVGEKKSYDHLEQIVEWVRQQVNANQASVMCPVEFLLDEEAEGETVKSTTHNYQMWECVKGSTTFDPAQTYEPGQLRKSIETAPTDSAANAAAAAAPTTALTNLGGGSAAVKSESESPVSSPSPSPSQVRSPPPLKWYAATSRGRPLSSTFGAMPGRGPQPASLAGSSHLAGTKRRAGELDSSDDEAESAAAAADVETPAKKPRVKALLPGVGGKPEPEPISKGKGKGRARA